MAIASITIGMQSISTIQRSEPLPNTTSERMGLLLVNLGSPDSTNPKDVRRYLHQFLNDPYVIDYPTILRYLLVNGIILNTRPKKSAEAYEKIWTKRGSPLRFHTEDLTAKVKTEFPFPVEFGMRYGGPSIEAATQSLISQGVNHIVMLPLYPQYSYAATETAIVEFESVVETFEGRIQATIIEHFHQHPAFIQALADSFRKPLEEIQPDLFLFSYHGIPVNQCTKTRNGLNYRDHCLETTELVKKELGLRDDQVMSTFQSRLGPVKWIEPYTDFVLETLPEKGIKNLVVASPSFTADCLETLEEIDMQYRELFLKSGGEKFHYIPCLNSSDGFVSAIKTMIEPHLA